MSGSRTEATGKERFKLPRNPNKWIIKLKKKKGKRIPWIFELRCSRTSFRPTAASFSLVWFLGSNFENKYISRNENENVSCCLRQGMNPHHRTQWRKGSRTFLWFSDQSFSLRERETKEPGAEEEDYTQKVGCVTNQTFGKIILKWRAKGEKEEEEVLERRKDGDCNLERIAINVLLSGKRTFLLSFFFLWSRTLRGKERED